MPLVFMAIFRELSWLKIRSSLTTANTEFLSSGPTIEIRPSPQYVSCTTCCVDGSGFKLHIT